VSSCFLLSFHAAVGLKQNAPAVLSLERQKLPKQQISFEKSRSSSPSFPLFNGSAAG
jgi:hypothetical protein